MATESLISITERLEEVLREAEMDGERMISEAKTEAVKIIDRARDEAKNTRIHVERGEAFKEELQKEERSAMEAAENIKRRYEERIELMRESTSERMDEAVQFLMREGSSE